MSTGASPTPFSRGRPSSASAPRRWPRRASPTPSPSRRSEEGRGGEEGRSWGAADYLKKKKEKYQSFEDERIPRVKRPGTRDSLNAHGFCDELDSLPHDVLEQGEDRTEGMVQGDATLMTP